MTPVSADPVVTVHFRALPVSLAARSREHSEVLFREFAEIAADEIDRFGTTARRGVPRQVLDLVIRLSQQFFERTAEAEARLLAAIAAGADTIEDHVLALPQEAAAAALEAGRMLDEADMYCWEHELQDLATPPECVAYRRWCFAQVLDQLGGLAPIPWPESSAARSLWGWQQDASAPQQVSPPDAPNVGESDSTV